MTVPGDAALRYCLPLRFIDMRGPSWRQDGLASRPQEAGLIGRVGLMVVATREYKSSCPRTSQLWDQIPALPRMALS
jgi:hypothetical protein